MKALIRAGADVGLHYDVKKTLIVRLPVGTEGPINVLIVYANGNVDTSYVWWQSEQLGSEALLRLQRDMAAAIPDAVVTSAAKMPAVGMPHRRPLTIQHVLDHADAWLEADA
ncbi:MAG: hypothetical protein DCC71_00315 [Proteobacteria bacterium]|nr:MAG: hypothetical protein DCC71_00315 [Pseudomonadota bacterium]